MNKLHCIAVPNSEFMFDLDNVVYLERTHDVIIIKFTHSSKKLKFESDVIARSVFCKLHDHWRENI